MSDDPSAKEQTAYPGAVSVSATLEGTVRMSPKDALAALSRALQEDPAYAWSWQCNLAMMAFDAGATHLQANERAADLMKSLFDVDVTEMPPYKGILRIYGEIGTAGVELARAKEGWKEAAIAWEVCASIHAKYAKGKDALYSLKQADYVRHASDARAKLK